MRVRAVPYDEVARWYAPGNRDEAESGHPDAFDVAATRTGTCRSAAAGPRRCLARLEAKVDSHDREDFCIEKRLKPFAIMKQCRLGRADD